MAEILDELKLLRAQFDTKVASLGKRAVQERFQELFDKYPQVKGLKWTQYAPEWLDGAPCNFGIHSTYYGIEAPYSMRDDFIEESQEYEGYEGPEDQHPYEISLRQLGTTIRYKDISHALNPLRDDLRRLFAEMDDSHSERYGEQFVLGPFATILLKSFGDGMSVEVTRDMNVVCKEYSHH